MRCISSPRRKLSAGFARHHLCAPVRSVRGRGGLFIRLGTLAVIMTASASAVLIVSMAVKIFAMGTFHRKIAWYVLDSLLLIVIAVFSGWRVSIAIHSSYCYLIYALVFPS